MNGSSLKKHSNHKTSSSPFHIERHDQQFKNQNRIKHNNKDTISMSRYNTLMQNLRCRYTHSIEKASSTCPNDMNITDIPSSAKQQHHINQRQRNSDIMKFGYTNLGNLNSINGNGYRILNTNSINCNNERDPRIIDQSYMLSKLIMDSIKARMKPSERVTQRINSMDKRANFSSSNSIIRNRINLDDEQRTFNTSTCNSWRQLIKESSQQQMTTLLGDGDNLRISKNNNNDTRPKKLSKSMQEYAQTQRLLQQAKMNKSGDQSTISQIFTKPANSLQNLKLNQCLENLNKSQGSCQSRRKEENEYESIKQAPEGIDIQMKDNREQIIDSLDKSLENNHTPIKLNDNVLKYELRRNSIEEENRRLHERIKGRDSLIKIMQNQLTSLSNKVLEGNLSKLSLAIVQNELSVFKNEFLKSRRNSMNSMDTSESIGETTNMLSEKIKEIEKLKTIIETFQSQKLTVFQQPDGLSQLASSHLQNELLNLKEEFSKIQNDLAETLNQAKMRKRSGSSSNDKCKAKANLREIVNHKDGGGGMDELHVSQQQEERGTISNSKELGGDIQSKDKEIENLKKENNNLLSKLARFNFDKKQVDNLQKDIMKSEQRVKELESIIQNKVQTIEVLTKQNQEKNSVIQQLNSLINEQQTQYTLLRDNHQKELSELREDNMNLQLQNNDLDAKNRAYQQQIDLLKEENSRLKGKIHELETQPSLFSKHPHSLSLLIQEKKMLDPQNLIENFSIKQPKISSLATQLKGVLMEMKDFDLPMQMSNNQTPKMASEKPKAYHYMKGFSFPTQEDSKGNESIEKGVGKSHSLMEVEDNRNDHLLEIEMLKKDNEKLQKFAKKLDSVLLSKTKANETLQEQIEKRLVETKRIEWSYNRKDKESEVLKIENQKLVKVIIRLEKLAQSKNKDIASLIEDNKKLRLEYKKAELLLESKNKEIEWLNRDFQKLSISYQELKNLHDEVSEHLNGKLHQAAQDDSGSRSNKSGKNEIMLRFGDINGISEDERKLNIRIAELENLVKILIKEKEILQEKPEKLLSGEIVPNLSPHSVIAKIDAMNKDKKLVIEDFDHLASLDENETIMNDKSKGNVDKNGHQADLVDDDSKLNQTIPPPLIRKDDILVDNEMKELIEKSHIDARIINNLKANEEQTRRHIDDLMNMNNRLNDELNVKSMLVRQLENRIDDLEMCCNQKEIEIGYHTKRFEALNSVHEKDQKIIKDLEKDLQDKNKELTQYDNKLKEAEKKLKFSMSEANKLVKVLQERDHTLESQSIKLKIIDQLQHEANETSIQYRLSQKELERTRVLLQEKEKENEILKIRGAEGLVNMFNDTSNSAWIVNQKDAIDEPKILNSLLSNFHQIAKEAISIILFTASFFLIYLYDVDIITHKR